MDDFKKLISENSSAFEDFFRTSKTVTYLILDSELNVISSNELLNRLLKIKQSFKGESVLKFLLPESQKILPFSDYNNHSVRMNFLASDGTTAPLLCHISKTKRDEYILLGGEVMLLGDEIIEKMTNLTNEMANMTRDLTRKNIELEEARSKIKTLTGIIPICVHCREVRNDQGYWNRLEKYISENSDAKFSHGLCNNCLEKYYPDEIEDNPDNS
ncbi:MAG: hypothetical protein JXR91_07505 [Deltaproteobacteria bacterium]|nr:hypothetical protein [Deltaproteobacteria bacterium]